MNSANTINFVDGPNGDIIQIDSLVEIPEFFNDTTFYVFLSSQYCEGPLDSLHISPKPYPDDPILATDAPVCTGTSVNLVVSNPNGQAIYHWVSPSGNAFSGDDVNHSVPDISEEGIYTCFADLDGCQSDTISIPISLFETVQLVLPPDTGMCFRGIFQVVPNAIFQSYLWQDGSTESFFNASETTEIFLVVHDFNNCQSYDAMNIELVDCHLDIPNIFTPNGDGKNDFWFVSIDQPLYVQIIVFNRWGTKVFDSNNLMNKWDGTNFHSGKECSEGVYFYLLKLRDFEDTNIEKTGTISLIRE